MRNRGIFMLVCLLLFAGQTFAAGESDLQIKSTVPGSTVTVVQMMADDKVLLSVNDEGNEPVFGLTAENFVITSGQRKAHIISALPASQSFDVPRNIVLVLDNSLSMSQRNAVQPLLAGVDELFKILRPIDRLEIVVFSQKDTVEMGGRELHVRTLSSNHVSDMKNFVTDSYDQGLATETFLYEAMFAGLELMRAMPENEPRFLVVFSDGEDINSAFKGKTVLQATEGLSNFQAYGIDFMPGLAKDRFLTSFTEGTHGETWKATSETNLVPIFQEVASRMEFYYLVNFLFPPSGTLADLPENLTIDEVENFDAAIAGGTGAAAPLVRWFLASALTLRPTVDSAYGIERWNLTVANTLGTLAALSGEGPPPAEIPVPLEAVDLAGLVRGGDIEISLEVVDARGQNAMLTAQPIKVSLLRTTGSLDVSPAMLTIEEVKTIDSSPMLGYVYFAEGSAEIPAQYVRLTGREETSSFDETRFSDTMEKYYQVLNIIGKRLVDHPEATIILTGCNANSGSEKGNTKLSGMRANAIRDYLLSVWGIAPQRIQTEERNLPEKPSSSRTEEGKAENRRVEIRSDMAELLAPIRSTYFATKIDADVLMLHPTVKAAHGVANWTVTAENRNGKIIATSSGQGNPPAELRIPLGGADLNTLATAGDIKVRMTIADINGQELTMTAKPITVNFIQTSQRLAEQGDYQIQEKYALILFDFDSDAISAGNQDIVTSIVSRMRMLPQATAEIVGHTDNIGKEEYNIKLSERRALAVYKLLIEAYGDEVSERIRYHGVGPHEPLYDNATPEARAFNRTVTITLEYTAATEG